MSQPRIRDAGDSALLLELEPVIDPQVNARAVAVAASVRRASIPGVRDVVPTFQAVAVYFDPLATDVDAVRAALEHGLESPAPFADGRTLEVPVVYGGDAGPDLGEVAAFAGMTPQNVIELHAAATYRVYMLGFLPGFAYLGTVDARIAAPRRAVPRLKITGGSVGIAGRQTGIYPHASPGGWQIIGRTALDVFDPERSPAPLFAPGDSVRFVRVKERTVMTGFSSTDFTVASVAATVPSARAPRVFDADLAESARRRHVVVVRPGLLTTVQDLGRWGHQATGVPVSGPLDPVAHRIANAAVGNPPDAAVLEVTIAGPELRFENDAVVAIAGADLRPTINGSGMPSRVAVRCAAGSTLRFGDRRAGARAYLAFDGGVAVPPVLGSRATHTLSGLGGMQGRALAAADRLPLGERRDAPGTVADVASSTSGGVRLRIIPGPQDAYFPDTALETLQRTRFTVGAQSNRMGYRLSGAQVPRLAADELISGPTFAGAIQVPPSGEPILLMADRQTTGGYPQVATVITADLPAAGQLAPGDWVEFQVCSRSDALAALRQVEGSLLALR